MNHRISLCFERLKNNNKKALIAYLAAGYPAFSDQKSLIRTLVKAGVDIIELGVPFSDPIADGPTIQFASQQALNNGVTMKKIFSFVKSLRREIDIPIILMGYMNSFNAPGLDRFAFQAKKAGVDGVIIADLIIEEGRGCELLFRQNNLDLIYLVAPTSSPLRRQLIASRTSGFLYAVSVAGVTGARQNVKKLSGSWISSLKKISRVPICVGFGISDAKAIRSFKNDCDGVIVGSALIDVIRRSTRSNRNKLVERFILPLAKECHYAS